MFQSTHPHGVRHFRHLPYLYLVQVSIHAPTRGATNRMACFSSGFQVSIHAPTRGATSGCNLLMPVIPVSIHAPTRGATRHSDFSQFTPEFQSTHPHGVRRRNGWFMMRKGGCFNPRTHTGCDFSQSIFCRRSSGFNPRTHTGCDVELLIN